MSPEQATLTAQLVEMEVAPGAIGKLIALANEHECYELTALLDNFPEASVMMSGFSDDPEGETAYETGVTQNTLSTA